MAGMPTWTVLGGGYQSYLKGDYAAAKEFVERYRKLIYSTLRRFCRTR